MRIINLLLVVLWLCHAPAYAQTKIKKLIPGSPTPDVKLKVYVGDKPKYIKLRELKSKLVILDYWSEGCSICISSMPELDSLQRVFGDKISIILVTQQPKPGADKLFKHVTVSRPNLMMVYGDTLLRKFFPHNSVPHHIWLEPRGTIRYIAGGYNTSANTISKFLSGKDIHLEYKNEDEEFDIYAPFFKSDGDNFLNGTVRYSALLGKIIAHGGGLASLIIDSSRKQYGIRMLNAHLLSLYVTAYGESISLNRFETINRIKLEVKRPDRFKRTENMEDWDDWDNENVYSYELRMKGATFKECFDQMKVDLRQSLPYQAEVKTISTTSYALVKYGDTDLLAARFPGSKSDNPDIHLRNTNYQELVNRLQVLSYSFEFPLAVEYQYEGNIDFDWPEFAPDRVPTVDELRPFLQKRGLDLVVKEAQQEMLVIKDK